jgi:hypothetical protein
MSSPRAVPGPRRRAPESPGLSRRRFLRRVALASGALAGPWLVPASALGLNGAVAPGSRIVLGAIGVGARGAVILPAMLAEPDVQLVAVCDVRRSQREAGRRMADTRSGNRDCATFRDLRELLARRDLDAVVIALGERWHATAAILAMQAGKDVYCEKPSSFSISEGRAVVAAAQRHGRIFQTGTQRLSESNFVFAFELARLGRLGRVHTAEAQLTPYHSVDLRHDWLPAEPEPPVDEVDWDLWLGPCPWRPYNSAYVRGKWREHYDFHTGSIGEWGAHSFAEAQAGLGMLHTSPAEYRHVNNSTGDGLETRFASGVKLILKRDGWGLGHSGIRLLGTEGWVSVADQVPKPEVSSPALAADYRKLLDDYVARTGRPLNHARDFFNAVKSRRPTVAGPEAMHRSMTTVHAANICMWLQTDLRYDTVKEEFARNPEANRLRSRPQRAPWHV